MKYIAVLTFVFGASIALQSPIAAADAAFLDPICPTVSTAVQNYVSLVKLDTTLVADAVAAANAASSAYDKCGDRYRSAGDAEHLHYAAVGAAQYHFAAGRLLRLDSHFDEARIAFQAAIDDVGDTIAWGRPTAPSLYKPSAVEVRDEALAEIAKLPSATAPLPAASTSSAVPSPEPTKT